MKNILLIGIGGVYNYGCEAIVRGSIDILRSEWPDIKITYSSFRPAEDRKRLKDCSLEIIKRQVAGRYSFKSIARKILSVLNLHWSPAMDSLSQLEKMDAVLSIGGDIYTLQPNGHFNASLPKFGNLAEKRGIPYILWGASVGPFDKNPKAERFFRKHLSRISLITARENDSVEYLRRIGISSNVIPCADPAFVVAEHIVRNQDVPSSMKIIGVNISPLSLKYIGLAPDQAVDSQSRMIERIVERTNAEVLLLPHVVCEFSEGDDDLRWLRRIKNNIKPPYSEKVSLVDHDPGYIGLKKILVQCDLVIAARMHCAINALAACVPTLILAYSQKAYGMSEYIYGHRRWVLPLEDIWKGRGLDAVMGMLESLSGIQKYLKRRIPEVQSDAKRPIQFLKQKKLFASCETE